MLVTTGIDMYAVDSRSLYCGDGCFFFFLAYRQKKRNTTDVLKKEKKKKDSWVPNQNTMKKKNVAHLKSNAIFIYIYMYVYIKYFKIVSWLQISS